MTPAARPRTQTHLALAATPAIAAPLGLKPIETLCSRRTRPVLSEQFLRVAGLLDPPTRLLRPGTLRRVLTGNLRAAPPRPPEAAGSPLTLTPR